MVPMKNIERASPVPYYEQLYDVLLDDIRGGGLKPGDRLPGESELHRTFGLSRATVRQALDLLDANGHAQKVARRGYFVSTAEASQGWLIEGLGGFLENGIGHSNAHVNTKVVSAGDRQLSDDAAIALRVPRGSVGFVLERVRSVDGKLALFSINWAPPAVAPVIAAATGVRDGTSSLTTALQAAGYVAAGAKRVVHAVAADRTLAAHLEVPEGTPLLRVRSTTRDKSHVPYDYYETWLRTDVVPLEVDATTSS